MNLLCLESTCDETAAAVVTDRLEVLSSAVASQDELHRRYGGVVPEIASRAHVERILPVIDKALGDAGLTSADIDAVAVANTPGLAGSLLVGLMAAKAICLARGVPLVAVNHLQAHVYACRMAAGTEVFPCVGLIVSGGHSSLYRCRGPVDFQFLGGTIDDAAGEAFDKVAAMLGLAYPGGPSIQRAAAGGNPTAFALPRAFLHDDRLDFSFSGLKTAVRYAIQRAGFKVQGLGGRGRGAEVRGQGSEVRGQWSEGRGQGSEVRGQGSEVRVQGLGNRGLGTSVPSGYGEERGARRGEWGEKRGENEKLRPKNQDLRPEFPNLPISKSPNLQTPNSQFISDLAASFQQAIVDCLVTKGVAALEQAGVDTLCVGGGVAANSRLREQLQQESLRRGFRLFIAPPQLCTDNAVMGAIAVERLRAGLVEPLDLDVIPGLVREGG